MIRLADVTFGEKNQEQNGQCYRFFHEFEKNIACAPDFGTDGELVGVKSNN